jgi:hypothetical protein
LSKSFSQLYDYLTRDSSSFTFSRNTYSNPKNKKEFLNEFYENARYIREARGKVFLYHEVLSLEQNSLSKERQKEILLDMADKYLFQRADKHLAFGVVHDEKEHMHLHLMISANEIEGDKRVRLSKKEFKEIQQRLENYKNQKHKELRESSFYQDKKDLSKTKQNEQELKNRGAKSIRDVVKENLEKTFNRSTSKKYLYNHLHTLDYQLYTRGNTAGVKFNGKKYRFKTLGLEQLYQQMYKKIERQEKIELKRQKSKNDRKISREKYQERE